MKIEKIHSQPTFFSNPGGTLMLLATIPIPYYWRFLTSVRHDSCKAVCDVRRSQIRCISAVRIKRLRDIFPIWFFLLSRKPLPTGALSMSPVIGETSNNKWLSKKTNGMMISGRSEG